MRGYTAVDRGEPPAAMAAVAASEAALQWEGSEEGAAATRKCYLVSSEYTDHIMRPPKQNTYGNRFQSGFGLDVELFDTYGSSNQSVLISRLQPNVLPKDVNVWLSNLFGFWESENDSYGFWREWYQGFLDGKPLDWELQRRVALIPDAEWGKGPAHIAEIIEKIRLEFRTSVGETIYRDEDAGVFRVRPETRLPSEPVQFARERIDMALGNALRNGAANGFRETSYEAGVIQTVLEKYPDDGSLLAVNFYDACMSLDRNIGDVYPDDTSLVILKNALFTAVEELCELDESAKERVQRLVKLGMPTEMLEPDRAAVREIADKISDLTDEELDRRIREASDILANTEKPPRVWRARLTNWVTTISIWMDRAKKGDGRLKWLADLVDRMRKWWPNAE